MLPEPRQKWLQNGYTLKQILAMDFSLDGFEEPVNLRTYLMELLYTLWEEGEGFSGKRPFGNSGWQEEVGAALVEAGLLHGESDEDGYADYDHREFLLMMKSLIYAL